MRTLGLLATLGLVACTADVAGVGRADRTGSVSSAIGPAPTADCGSGTRTTDGTDVICSYTNVGTATFTPPADVSQVQVLVVGGGGGGAMGGGGGAGGYLYEPALGIGAGAPVTVTVGDGGVGSDVYFYGSGYNGGDSSFGAMTALGGGGGGGYTHTGNVGGSAGGNGCDVVITPTAGTAGQGNAGGRSHATSYGGAGGGGGAGAPGDDGGPTFDFPGQNPTIGGNGGSGLPNAIRGTNVYYAGGGGGGVNTNDGAIFVGGLGGQGGGGNGARANGLNPTQNSPLSAGTPNTGGGGGGGDCEGWGGPGGSGIVVVRYSVGVHIALASSVNPAATGADVTFTATLNNGPTGAVQFSADGSLLGSSGIDAATHTATFATSTLSAGFHTIAAVYEGDTSFAGGAQSQLLQRISAVATTTALAIAPSPGVEGEDVVLTATVIPAAEGLVTGSVVFQEGTKIVGAASVSGTIATYTTNKLAVGDHKVIAFYGGDTRNSPSTSAEVTETIAASNVPPPEEADAGTTPAPPTSASTTPPPSSQAAPAGTTTNGTNGTNIGGNDSGCNASGADPEGLLLVIAALSALRRRRTARRSAV